MVVIVDDPKKGIVEGNLIDIGFNGPERCKHLVGTTPGKYSCAIHDKKWYKKTPCFRHGQIEMSQDSLCRMGEFIMKGRGRNPTGHEE